MKGKKDYKQNTTGLKHSGDPKPAENTTEAIMWLLVFLPRNEHTMRRDTVHMMFRQTQNETLIGATPESREKNVKDF